MATVLGVDYGHKKIGFAVGQTITGTAQPLTVVYQNQAMWHHIDKLFATWNPKRVIVGEPRLADGKPHPLEKKIENFINSLQKRYNASICRVDETLTSFEAAQYDEKCQKSERALDAYAAAIFLESWMRERLEANAFK